jgi:hypothetical protein
MRSRVALNVLATDLGFEIMADPEKRAMDENKKRARGNVPCLF